MRTICFAKWNEDKEGNAYRDGTILQYGDSWELIGNVVLLNPGSSVPINNTTANKYIKDHYRYFDDNGEYYEFSVDPLMKSLVELFKKKYPNSGVIGIFNLFNLKNPDSEGALEEFAKHSESEFMQTPEEAIDFHNVWVMVSTGKNVHTHTKLEKQLHNYVAKAPKNSLFSIQRKDKTTFLVKEATPDKNGLVESYHLSYTSKYGNTTEWE